MQDSNDCPLMASTQTTQNSQELSSSPSCSIVPPVIMDEDVHRRQSTKISSNSINNNNNNNNNKANKRRRKHRIPGPAGEGLMLTSSKAGIITAVNMDERHDRQHQLSIPNKYKKDQHLLLLQSSSQEDASLSSQEDHADVVIDEDSGIIGVILQHSLAWTACCISLERYVDFHERDLLCNNNNNEKSSALLSAHKSSSDVIQHQLYLRRIEAVHKCFNQYSNGIGASYTTIGDILTGQHDAITAVHHQRLNIASKLLVVYVYSVQCHMHSDWTCELRDETGRSIMGWLEERFVKDRPEGARPGAVLLLKGCSFSVFSADAVLEGTADDSRSSSSSGAATGRSSMSMDGNGNGSQRGVVVSQPHQQEDDRHIERMLLIGINTVVYNWVPEEGVHISREEKMRLMEGRRRVRAMISGRKQKISSTDGEMLFENGESTAAAAAVEAYKDILVAGNDSVGDHDVCSTVEELTTKPLASPNDQESSTDALSSSLQSISIPTNAENEQNEDQRVSIDGPQCESQDSSSGSTFVTPLPQDFAEEPQLLSTDDSPNPGNTAASSPHVANENANRESDDAFEPEKVEMMDSYEKTLNEVRHDQDDTKTTYVQHKNPYKRAQCGNGQIARSAISAPRAKSPVLAHVDEKTDGRGPPRNENRLLSFAALASPTARGVAGNKDMDKKAKLLPTNDNENKRKISPNIQKMNKLAMTPTKLTHQNGINVKNKSQSPVSSEKQSIFNDLNSFGTGSIFSTSNANVGAKSLFEGAAFSDMFDGGDFDEDEW